MFVWYIVFPVLCLTCCLECGFRDKFNKLRNLYKGKTTPVPPEAADEVDKLYERLRKSNNSYSLDENERFEMRCDNPLVNKLLDKYPSAALKWTKNGHPLELDRNRMQYKSGILVILSVEDQDTGVYVCQIEYSSRKKQVETVELYTLVVNSNKIHLLTTVGFEEELTCHSTIIGMLFKDSTRQRWYCNGALFRDYKSTPPQDVNRDKFVMANQSMAGVWICEVTDSITGHAWKTNRVVVQVSPGLVIWDRLQTYSVGVSAVAIVLDILVLMCMGFMWRSRKKDREADADFEMMRPYSTRRSSTPPATPWKQGESNTERRVTIQNTPRDNARVQLRRTSAPKGLNRGMDDIVDEYVDRKKDREADADFEMMRPYSTRRSSTPPATPWKQGESNTERRVTIKNTPRDNARVQLRRTSAPKGLNRGMDDIVDEYVDQVLSKSKQLEEEEQEADFDRDVDDYVQQHILSSENLLEEEDAEFNQDDDYVEDEDEYATQY